MKNLHKGFAVILCIVFFIQCFNFSQVIPYYGTQVNAEGGTDGKVLPEQTGLASPAKSDLVPEFLGAGYNAGCKIFQHQYGKLSGNNKIEMATTKGLLQN